MTQNAKMAAVTALATTLDCAALTREIGQREEALKPLYAGRDQLNDRIVAEREAIGALQDQHDALRIAAMGEDTDWSFLLSSSSRRAYKELSKRIEAAGFRSNGQWADTLQACVKFVLCKNRPDEVARASAFAQEVLPHILPDKEGFKRFGVFEASLSSGGSYSVYINEEAGQFQVRLMRHYRTRTLFEAPNLRELVQYLHDNVYYDDESQSGD